MDATPRPRAAVPGQVSRRCKGGDSNRLYRLRSRPCDIKAPARSQRVSHVMSTTHTQSLMQSTDMSAARNKADLHALVCKHGMQVAVHGLSTPYILWLIIIIIILTLSSS